MSGLGQSAADLQFMHTALRLARRGYGTTSPNPMVGAVLVKDGQIIGRGWHHRAGGPHAEIEALRHAQTLGHSARGATLYATLEPCSTQGRTPACTDAIVQSGLRRVVVGATDPNPRHAGRAFSLLKQAGIKVAHGLLSGACERLNETFNHWIVHRRPLVTVKAAMTLDGKLATAAGHSKWITGERARAYAMRLRQGADAILVGINTVLLDDPALTCRSGRQRSAGLGSTSSPVKSLRRIVLDSRARTPLDAKVVSDDQAAFTTIIVSSAAPKTRVKALEKRVRVLVAPAASAQASPAGLRRTTPARHASIDLRWLLRTLGDDEVTSLLVEGGGEVQASFLMAGLAQRIAFFYAPKILGGRHARRAIAGEGAHSLAETLDLHALRWRMLGPDWFVSAHVRPLVHQLANLAAR